MQLGSSYIELSRRFRDLDEKELESSEFLAMSTSLFSERIEAVEALEDPDATRDRKDRTTHAPH